MSQDHTTQTIITALNETEERPRGQIAAIVRALGEESALALLVEANEIERSGGMMLPDGSRRRTPGGVYFTLARRKLSPEDRDAIFPKSPPAMKREGREGDRSDEAANRPERRHVRLITSPANEEPGKAAAEPAKPTFALTSPGSLTGASAPVSAAAASAPTTTNGAAHAPDSSPRPTNGTAAEEPKTEGKQEVKLVRLDRRRIVTLPPPKPDTAAASQPAAPPAPRPPRPAIPRAEEPPAPMRRPPLPTPSSNILGTRAASAHAGHAPGQANQVNQEEQSLRHVRAPAGLDLALQRTHAKKRITAVLSELKPDQQRLVLLDLLAENPGDLGQAEPLPAAQTPELRGKILAAVGNRLGIAVGQLATTIYGADTPANRRRVKALVGEND